jgi:hypothetical protein
VRDERRSAKMRRMSAPSVVPVEIVRRAVEIFRVHFALLYPIALIFGLLQAMVTFALEDTDVVALGLAFSLLAATFFQGIVVGFVRDVQAGAPRRSGAPEPTAGALLKDVVPVVDKLLAVSLLGAVGIGIGLVALIVPGLFLLTWWAVIGPVVVLERTPVLETFRRSRALVLGHGWPVLRTLLLLVFLLFPVILVAALATSALGDAAGSFVQVLLGALVSTVTVVSTAILYFRLRELEDERTATAADDDAATPDRDDAAIGDESEAATTGRSDAAPRP